jgi:hypothetical protein
MKVDHNVVGLATVAGEAFGSGVAKSEWPVMRAMQASNREGEKGRDEHTSSR